MLSVPLGYLRRQFNFSRDVRLFLFYNLLANVGWGVFTLIFNLYLRELNLREDDMGAFSAAQTLAMAGGAATMGTVLDRLGIWRSIVSGRIGLSTGLARARLCRGAPAAPHPVGHLRRRARLPVYHDHAVRHRLDTARRAAVRLRALILGHFAFVDVRFAPGRFLAGCVARRRVSRPIAGHWWRVPALPRSVWSRCSSCARRAGAAGCRTQPR